MNTDVSDFNLWHMSDYGRNVFLVAGRFFDLAPDRWELLTCIWYGRNGLTELKDDRYVTETEVRYKSVDALVAETDPKPNDIGAHLYSGWTAKKAALAKKRKTPPVVVLPPTPTPPEPKPEPKPDDVSRPHPRMPDPIPQPEPEPKPTDPNAPAKPKAKIPWKTIATILGAISFGLSFFPVPGIVKDIIGWVVKILNSLPG